MTRHAYIDGTPESPGHVFFEQDGARLRCELEPEDVIAALDAYMGRRKPVPDDMEKVSLAGEPAGHWSDWLPWSGGPCPLPWGAIVEYRVGAEVRGRFPAGGLIWARDDRPDCITAFRYLLADNPAGWLPRGDWIPPAELWAPECPVRLHIRTDNGGEGWAQHYPRDWDGITHIRLVAREPQAGLPEGWSVRKDGALISPHGIHAFTAEDRRQFGPAAIRQAVDAWLREMGDE